MGLYVLAKNVSLVSVKVLIVICMIFGIDDWVWPQHPQLLPRAAIRLEYVVPRVGRQSRGELPSGAENLGGNLSGSPSQSKKVAYELGSISPQCQVNIHVLLAGENARTPPSLLIVGLSLMLFLTS